MWSAIWVWSVDMAIQSYYNNMFGKVDYLESLEYLTDVGSPLDMEIHWVIYMLGKLGYLESHVLLEYASMLDVWSADQWIDIQKMVCYAGIEINSCEKNQSSCWKKNVASLSYIRLTKTLECPESCSGYEPCQLHVMLKVWLHRVIRPTYFVGLSKWEG